MFTPDLTKISSTNETHFKMYVKEMGKKLKEYKLKIKQLDREGSFADVAAATKEMMFFKENLRKSRFHYQTSCTADY